MSEQIERLLAQMPKMAEAVNAFASEDVQRRAFNALMAEFRGADGVDEDDDDDADAVNDQPAVDVAPKKATRRLAPKATGSNNGKQRGRAAGVAIDKNLNLRPKAGKSFDDFATEKKPATQYERCLVSVYYLERIAKQTPVTANGVYTCFKDRGWRVPADLHNALQKTGSDKGWLNTKKSDDLKVTVPGENYVEHDLPTKSAK